MVKIKLVIQTLKNNWLILLAISLLTIAYLVGIPEVPFHPDESTQLFMSADIELFFADPSSLFWRPQNEQDLRQHYRELDAPLTRYLAGIVRQITRHPPLPQDWNWSASWEENQSTGALPDAGLLLAGRLSAAIFFPLNLYFLYKIMQKVHSSLAAWLSIFFFASNALILLHTRRVMAEGVLTFTILLTLYAISHLKRHQWLIAIPTALAFSSKQSTASLIGLGMVAVFMLENENHEIGLKKRAYLFRIAQYLSICLLVLFLLNPFLWKHPVRAGQAAWKARSTLTTSQITTIAEKNPEKILTSAPQRTLGILANLFITPPAVADVANYQEQTLESATVYLNNPLNNFFRGPVWGSIYLVLCLFGFITALMKWMRNDSGSKWLLILLILATILQFLSLIFFVTIPFQRYVIPLVPYSCIWQAYGLSTLLLKMRSGADNQNTPNDQ